MFARVCSTALLLLGMYYTEAQAQYGYGGYLQMDHADLMAPLYRIVQKADAAAEQSLQQLMQMPELRERYKEFQQAGGQLSYRDYVAWFARTAGFTPQGVRHYLTSEQRRNAQWQRRQDEFNQTNDEARRAQWEGMDKTIARQREWGNIIAGYRTYVESNGASYELPFNKPGIYRDSEGRLFGLDQHGNYTRWSPSEWRWIPLQAK
ncbi:MAG TPA: hypothetical protein PKD72_11715 [Gemmatales bacterium]|nr:hypothetical protein [Gemmatales bacterium]